MAPGAQFWELIYLRRHAEATLFPKQASKPNSKLGCGLPASRPPESQSPWPVPAPAHPGPSARQPVPHQQRGSQKERQGGLTSLSLSGLMDDRRLRLQLSDSRPHFASNSIALHPLLFILASNVCLIGFSSIFPSIFRKCGDLGMF